MSFYDGPMDTGGYQPVQENLIFKPPTTGSGVQLPKATVPNKEEVILRLVESLNIGGEESDYKRVDVAFMQYEQIQKKLNGWKEF